MSSKCHESHLCRRLCVLSPHLQTLCLLITNWVSVTFVSVKCINLTSLIIFRQNLSLNLCMTGVWVITSGLAEVHSTSPPPSLLPSSSPLFWSCVQFIICVCVFPALPSINPSASLLYIWENLHFVRIQLWSHSGIFRFTLMSCVLCSVSCHSGYHHRLHHHLHLHHRQFCSHEAPFTKSLFQIFLSWLMSRHFVNPTSFWMLLERWVEPWVITLLGLHVPSPLTPGPSSSWPWLY